jgi:hypothetical protein
MKIHSAQKIPISSKKTAFFESKFTIEQPKSQARKTACPKCHTL